MTDEILLDLLWERSEDALHKLRSAFDKVLQRICMNILDSPQDAEEVVNDTYLAIWNAIPPQRPSSLSAYACKTGKQLALKKLRFLSARKRSSQYEVSLEELSGVLSGNSLEETLDARILGEAINRYLRTLDETNRRIFLRRYWFGDSVKALAKAEGMTPNALSLRLSRLRDGLRTHLEKEDIFV